jgi:hypothetical protein
MRRWKDRKGPVSRGKSISSSKRLWFLKWLIIVPLVSAGGCTADVMYTRDNFDFAKFVEDSERCKGQVATLVDKPQGIVPLNPAQAIGSVIGAAIVSGMTGSTESNLLGRCLERRGYSKIVLTAEAQKKYSALTDAQEKSKFLRLWAKRHPSAQRQE